MITMSAAEYGSFGVKTIKPWYRLEPVLSDGDYLLPNKVMTDLDMFYVNGDSDAGLAFDELKPIEAVTTEDVDFYWKYSSFHVDFERESKSLALMNDYIRLSVDGGSTYPTKIYFEGTDDIGMSYIFSNGNIIWATKDKIYISTDNLASYSEITVKDTDGTNWTPTGDGENFRVINVDRFVDISGVEYLVWGNYGNVNSTNQTNVYYTVDSGVNIKIAYSFDNGALPVDCRHVHAVNFNPNDSSFWVQTGDYINDCNWIKGVYDSELDEWVFSLEKLGSEDDYSKTAGMYFTATDMYWGSDCTDDTNKRSIFKVPIADIKDENEYVKLYGAENEIISNFKMNSDGEIVSNTSGEEELYLLISNDYGSTINKKTITPPVSDANSHRIGNKNTDDWWRMDCAPSLSDSTKYGTLWVKLK